MNVPRTSLTLTALAVLAFVIYAALGIYTVPEGHNAVETFGGRITGTVGPGFHHVFPVIEGRTTYNTTKVFEIPLRNLEIYYSPDEKPPEAYVATANGKSIAEIRDNNAQQYTVHQAVIRASTNPEYTQDLHRKYQSMASIARLVSDRGVQAYKDAVRQIDPLKINSQRSIIGTKTKDKLQRTIDEEVGIPEAIHVESVVFLDFNFERGVAAKFEEANQARAGIQAEEFARQKAKISVEKQRLEGQAQAAREAAAAQGRADAIRIEGQALAANPAIIELRKIEAWKHGGAQVPQTLLVPEENGAANVILPLGGTAR
jgi:regulator of protease activity HflC (stomatin/prohibitin superfamily)